MATSGTVLGRRELGWLASGSVVLIGAGLGALSAESPGLGLTVLVLGTAFLIGLLAPLELVFPLFGFLIVFDSVFSLGTAAESITFVILGFSISNPLVVGLTVRLFAEAAFGRRQIPRLALWVGGTIFVAGFLSSLLSTPDVRNPLGGFTRASVTTMGVGLVCVVVLSFGTEQLLRRLLLGVACGTMVAAVAALAAAFSANGGGPVVGKAYSLISPASGVLAIPRVTGIYQDPLALGFAIIVGMFATLASVRRGWLRWLMVAGFLCALPLTYSRGALGAAALGLFAYALIRQAPKISLFATGRRGGRGIFYVGVIAGAGALLFVYTWASQSPTLARFWNVESIEIREHALRLALDTWKANPVLGIGPGHFVQYYGVEAHNTFLQMAAEMGTIGLMVILALTWLAVARSASRASTATDPEEARAYGALAAGMVAVFIVAVTLTLVGVKLLWVVLAVGALSAPRVRGATASDPRPSPIRSAP